MKEFLREILFRLRRMYRVSLDFRKPENVLWNDLKEYHIKAEFHSGIYEKEKTIETSFEICADKLQTFYYQVLDGNYHCRVKVLEDFNPELTSDVFILAAHFNNLLNTGIVVVNVSSQYVEYHVKRDILLPLLYNTEIHIQLINHYRTAKDIYMAFNRLVEEEESPAIIIADLMKSKENEDNQAE